jgi:hypothetical protein
MFLIHDHRQALSNKGTVSEGISQCHFCFGLWIFVKILCFPVYQAWCARLVHWGRSCIREKQAILRLKHSIVLGPTVLRSQSLYIRLFDFPCLLLMIFVSLKSLRSFPACDGSVTQVLHCTLVVTSGNLALSTQLTSGSEKLTDTACVSSH